MKRWNAGQPPLPPGQPPAVPGGTPGYDYYWAQQQYSAAQAQAQAQAAAAAVGNATAAPNLYPNYGYGPAATWQNHPHHGHRPFPQVPPPPPSVAPPPPLAEPGTPIPPGYGYIPTQYPYAVGRTTIRTFGAMNPPPPKRTRLDNPNEHYRQQQQQQQQRGRPPTGPAADSATTPFGRGRGRGGRNPTISSRGMRGGGRGGSATPMRNNGRGTSNLTMTPRGPRRGIGTPARLPRIAFEAPQSHNGWGNGPAGPPAPSVSITTNNPDKEGKRTLTDFRILGFGFTVADGSWSWGSTRPVDDEVLFPTTTATATATVEPQEIKEEKNTEISTDAKEKPKRTVKETARIRIYFQPAPGAHSRRLLPMPSSEMVPAITVSRTSAKRKKSDDEEDDVERGNAKRHHGDEPRSASVEMVATDSPSKGDVAEPQEHGSEVSNDGDWLVEALHEGEDDDDDEEIDELGDDSQHQYDEDSYPEQGAEAENDSLFGSVHPSPPDETGSDLIVQPIASTEAVVEETEESKSTIETPPTNRNKRRRKDDDESTVVVTTAATPVATGGQSGAGGPGAGNKLSLSFASSSRRLVLEAEVVQYLKVFRAEGRIEFSANLEAAEEGSSIRGVCMDVWNEEAQAFQSVELPSTSVADSSLPPLGGVIARTVTFHVFLDNENPLSVPRWVKTGDVDDWLQSMFGASAGRKNATVNVKGWEGKITVVDPDPAPTIQNILEHWATNSVTAQQKDREQFLRQYFYTSSTNEETAKKEHDVDSVMEILLRLIRGDRPLIGSNESSHGHHHHHHHSTNNTVHPLLQAAIGDPVMINQQTHSSLAVLAIFRVLQETAGKYGGDDAKKEVGDRVKDIIKCLPQHMLMKSLDGMFQKWTQTSKAAKPAVRKEVSSSA